MTRKQRIQRYIIGERLRQLRGARRREELATKLTVSVDTIARWELGDPVKEPDCHRLAKALGVSLEELIGADRVSEPSGSYLPPGAEPLPTRYVKVPLLGTCPASAKQIINDEVVDWEYLPRELVRGQRVYLLKIKGDSMNRAGIDDGDRVVVYADQQPENGEITVALVDGECTIKRWFRSDYHITLTPDSTNPKHQPQTFTKANEVLVRGVVRAVWMKRLK